MPCSSVLWLSSLAISLLISEVWQKSSSLKENVIWKVYLDKHWSEDMLTDWHSFSLHVSLLWRVPSTGLSSSFTPSVMLEIEVEKNKRRQDKIVAEKINLKNLLSQFILWDLNSNHPYKLKSIWKPTVSKAQLLATMNTLFSSSQVLFEFQASLMKQDSIGSGRAERKQPRSPASFRSWYFFIGERQQSSQVMQGTSDFGKAQS